MTVRRGGPMWLVYVLAAVVALLGVWLVRLGRVGDLPLIRAVGFFYVAGGLGAAALGWWMDR